MDAPNLGGLLDALAPHEVLPIGHIAVAIVEMWGESEQNTLVVVTGERWRHIFERHPEVRNVCDDLPMLLLNPDEVHRNLAQVNIAIFYLRISDENYLRAAVAMQSHAGVFKHSVLSCRICRPDEVTRGRARSVYRR